MKNRKVGNQSRTAKKSRPRRQRSSKPIAPRTAEQYFAKPLRAQELWNRVTHVIAKMRANKLSLQKASREFGVDPRTVVKRGGTALRKSETGRYEAKKSDRLLRVLVVPTHDGTRDIAVRGSRRASQLGEYWSAVHKYLQTGDPSGLQKFRGQKTWDIDGEQIPFITDPAELKRLGSAGVFSFESMYARVA
jgi:hypothetical protein